VRRIAAACLVLMLAAVPAGAQNLPGSTEETRAAARELALTLGVENQVGQMLDLMRGQMLQMIQSNAPGKSPVEVKRIVDDLLLPEFRAQLGGMKDLIIEIYAANYSLEDMKALREFYTTPLGQRLLKAAPVLAQQSFIAGRKWGEKVAADAIRKNAEELRRRGLTL